MKLALIATVGALLWFVLSPSRGPRHWGWVRRAWIGMGLPVISGVGLTGRYDLLVSRPAEFDGLAAWLPVLPGAGEMALAGLGGIGLGLIVRGLLRRRVPDRIAYLVPRHRGEIAGVAAMAITAGIVEEAMFRVWLPWLVAVATGSALAGHALGTLVFAALHFRQRVVGIVGAGAIGALMAVLYLATGALWLAIVLHAVLNLGALLATRWFSSSAATRSGRSS